MKITINWGLTVVFAGLFLGSALGQFTYNYVLNPGLNERVKKLEYGLGVVSEVCLLYMDEQEEAKKEKFITMQDDCKNLIDSWKTPITFDPNYILENFHYELPPESKIDKEKNKNRKQN